MRLYLALCLSLVGLIALSDEVLQVTSEAGHTMKGVEDTRIFEDGTVFLKPAEDESLVIAPVQAITVATSETATIDVRISNQDREPTPFRKVGRGVYLVDTPGKHWVDVVSIELIDGKIEYKREFLVVEIGEPEPPKPPPPKPGDFTDLQKKSRELSLAMNDAATRTQLGLSLSRESFGATLATAQEEARKAFMRVAAKRSPDDKDWQNGWYVPVLKEIQSLSQSGKVSNIQQWHTAMAAVVAGLRD